MLGPRDNLKQLSMVAETGLAFICLSAGAELYMPQIRESLKQILCITLGFTTAQLLFGTAAVVAFARAGLLAHPDDASTVQLIALGLLCSCVATALAPGSVLGLIRETKSRGPFTSVVMGNTAIGCMIALVLFSVCSAFANTALLGGGFSLLALVFLGSNLLASFLVGWVVGKICVVLLNLNARWPRVPSQWAILLLGWATEQIGSMCDHFSLMYLKADLSIESLIVTIVAGYVATNQVGNRAKFLTFLSEVSPYVFVPFFTLSGAKVNAAVLAKALLFALSYFCVRTLACAAGCIPLGLALGQKKTWWRAMWLTFSPQGGMSFGLVAKTQLLFEGAWGQEFGTAMLGFVLIDLIAGPIVAKAGLRMSGEIPDGAADADDLVLAAGSPTRRVLVVGADGHAVAAMRRILDARCHVTLLDTDADRLTLVLSQLAPQDLVVPPGAPAGPAGGSGVPFSPAAPTMPRPPSRSVDRDGMMGSALPPSASRELLKELSRVSFSEFQRTQLERSKVYYKASSIGPRLLDLAKHAGAPDANDDGEGAVEALVAAVAEATYDVAPTSVECALVALPTDRQNHAVAEYLVHALGLKRVVCLLRNASWGKAMAALGVIATAPESLATTFLYKAALTPADAEMHVLRGKPRPGLALALVHAADAAARPVMGGPAQLCRLLQPQAERIDFERMHPEPRPAWLEVRKDRRLRQGEGGYLSAMANLNYTEKYSAEHKDALVPTSLLGAAAAAETLDAFSPSRHDVRVDIPPSSLSSMGGTP